MAKRAASFQEFINSINEILAKTSVFTSVNGEWKYVDCTSSEGQAFKHGLCEALEIALHKTNNYKGYMCIGLSEEIVDKFMRKYF
jgi:hypothetical protein